MVNINSFKFDNTYQRLEVNVSISQDEIQSGLYITAIKIGTQNAYDVDIADFNFEGEGSISPLPYAEDYDEVDYTYGWVFTPTDSAHLTEFSATINLDTNNMSINDLYFIKVETDGTHSASTPCSQIGPVWSSLYDKFSIDAKGMQYMKELADDCNTPTDLVDYILNKNAVDVAAGCGDYATMISRYNELMGYSNVTTISSVTNNYKKCGCNG